MSDPYNSVGAQMAAPPPLNANAPAPRPVRDPIAALDVSETWKRRFRLIEQAGGPGLPHQRELTSGERLSINFNFLAFFFGVFYYLAKGMWRQALAYVVLIFVLSLVLVALGWDNANRALATAFYIMFGMRANVSYYRRMVLGEKLWL